MRTRTDCEMEEEEPLLPPTLPSPPVRPTSIFFGIFLLSLSRLQ